MPLLTIREAAETVGTSKASVFRAIRAGRLSATRDDGGGFRVDPAELMRAFDPSNRPRAASTRVDTPAMEQSESAPSDVMELRIRVAEEAARAKLAEERLADLKGMLEEMKADRERWRSQAERFALAPPAVSRSDITTVEPRGWWPWRRRA